MVDLATELAQTCVTAMRKRADDPLAATSPTDIRNQFEALSSKERLLRSQAGRYSELAKSRAEDEDQSLGGYAGTAVSRMLPIPHTGTEAAVRLPAIGAGILGGYHYGKQFEPLDEDALKSVFMPSGGKGGAGSAVQPMIEQLFSSKYKSPEHRALAESLLSAGKDKGKGMPLEGFAQSQGVNLGSTSKILSALRQAQMPNPDPKLTGMVPNYYPGMTPDQFMGRAFTTPMQQALGEVAYQHSGGHAPPSLERFGAHQGIDIHAYKQLLADLSSRKKEELQQIFQKKEAPLGLGLSEPLKPHEEAMRTNIENILGTGAVEKLRGAAESAAKQGKKPANMVESLTPSFSRKGLRGAAGMGGLAALISGLPYAIRALIQKRQGGEASVRAKRDAKERFEQAMQLPGEREKLLQRLQGMRKTSSLNPLARPKLTGGVVGGMLGLPVGAAIGGVSGGIKGLVSPDEDENGNKDRLASAWKSLLRGTGYGALIGGGLGAAGGAVGGHILDKKLTIPIGQKAQEVITQVQPALNTAADVANREFAKTHGVRAMAGETMQRLLSGAA